MSNATQLSSAINIGALLRDHASPARLAAEGDLSDAIQRLHAAADEYVRTLVIEAVTKTMYPEPPRRGAAPLMDE